MKTDRLLANIKTKAKKFFHKDIDFLRFEENINCYL